MFIPILKLSAKSIAAIVIGWLSGEVFTVAFQVEPTAWYQNPAVVAAAVTAVFLIISKFLEHYWDRGKNNEKRSQEFSSKIQELTYAERRELLGGLNSLHEKELDFLKDQLLEKDISEFDLRERTHAFANEVNRQQGHIMACQLLLASNHIEVPEFELRHYNRIIEHANIEEKVEKFRLSRIRSGD